MRHRQTGFRNTVARTSSSYAGSALAMAFNRWGTRMGRRFVDPV